MWISKPNLLLVEEKTWECLGITKRNCTWFFCSPWTPILHFFFYMLLSASNESHFQVTNDVKGFVKSEAFSYLYQYMPPGRRLPALPKMLTFMLSKVECILTQVDQMILQPTGITLQGQWVLRRARRSSPVSYKKGKFAEKSSQTNASRGKKRNNPN